jgi:hypothetical protein
VSTDTSASGRAWARAGIALGAASSLGINYQAAWLTVTGHAPYAKQAAAVMWPLFLIATVEVMARTTWPKVGGWKTWGWLVVRFGGLGSIGTSSAVISYTHVHAVLMYWGYGEAGARAGAVCMDGLMVLCGFALLASNRTAETTTKPAAVGTPVTDAAPGQQEPTAQPAAPAVHPETGTPATPLVGVPQTRGGSGSGPALPAPDAGPEGAPISPPARPDTAPAGAPGSAPLHAPAGAPDHQPSAPGSAPAGLHLVSSPGAPDTAPDVAPKTAPEGAPARRRTRAASAPGVHRVTARTSAPARTLDQIAADAQRALAADPTLSRRRLARQINTSQDRLRDALGPAGDAS